MILETGIRTSNYQLYAHENSPEDPGILPSEIIQYDAQLRICIKSLHGWGAGPGRRSSTDEKKCS